MFEFTEAVSIGATAESVWSRLSDLESWWLPSYPEHIVLDIRSPGKRVAVGTEIAFEECVAGIKASATGAVTSLIPGVAATWEGAAKYRHLGLELTVQEGVTWRIEPKMGGSTLSAHVWARFPAGAFGRFLEWYSTRILHSLTDLCRITAGLLAITFAVNRPLPGKRGESLFFAGKINAFWGIAINILFPLSRLRSSLVVEG